MRLSRFCIAVGVALLGSPLVLAQNPRHAHDAGPEVFARRVVATNLGNPWEVTWGPDDYLWVTERSAFRVTRINPQNGSKHQALVLDDVFQSIDQDGLLGLALHPDLLRGKGTDFVYVAYTYGYRAGRTDSRRLRVRRYTYDAATETLRAPFDVLENLPAHDDHGGGRLAVGPDMKLYLTRGDQGSNFLANFCNPNRAQDLPTTAEVQARDWSAYQGKILRLNLDGSIPDDNPPLQGVRSHIYTYGHRNPQGMVFGAGGLLYVSDHGPSTDDELNLLERGKNYGWPHVAGFADDRAYLYANWSASAPTPCSALKFDNYNPPASVPQAKETAWHHPDFVPPLATLFTAPTGYDFKLGTTTVAPAGIDIYTSKAIPGWADSVLVATMRAGAVYRLKLTADGRHVDGAPVQYFKSNDRYRDLAIHPDGRRIYLVTDNHGVTADADGRTTDVLANPASLLELTYSAPTSSGGR